MQQIVPHTPSNYHKLELLFTLHGKTIKNSGTTNEDHTRMQTEVKLPGTSTEN